MRIGSEASSRAGSAFSLADSSARRVRVFAYLCERFYVFLRGIRVSLFFHALRWTRCLKSVSWFSWRGVSFFSFLFFPCLINRILPKWKGWFWKRISSKTLIKFDKRFLKNLDSFNFWLPWEQKRRTEIQVRVFEK